MTKLFIGYVRSQISMGTLLSILSLFVTITISKPFILEYLLKVLPISSGLAWQTDDNRLRQKFEEFGNVEEAVRIPS